MLKITLLILLNISIAFNSIAQETIPLNTDNWEINAQSYVLENYKGKDAIYLQGGAITHKDSNFLNGTIEFDIFLKQEQAFPGLTFRINKNDAEVFYIRPHLPGKPDANQVASLVNGITPWQLNFGPTYSFPYEYKYDDWTHVKIVVNGKKAQVFLDYSEQPNLSWNLFHSPREGGISIRGGRFTGMHLADIRIDKTKYEIKNFNPIEREPIADLVPEWEISDKFEEKLLDDTKNIKKLIKDRKWGKKIKVEEGVAANISRVQLLRDGNPGETVFAKITIRSDKDQIKLFNFGYSDRVLAILNGVPIYKGNNKWRSRDYRYLGTVGLFDAIYLDLKKGENTLLLAVSEDFGGWLVTGQFENKDGIKIQ